MASTNSRISSVLDRFEPVIGLEVHCQLNTKSKLFCRCPTDFGALPNHHTCPICLGHPGVLPVLNEEAVNFAIRLALAIGAQVHERSIFARKQYFYPDLPKGYQISQHEYPYCNGGSIKLLNGKVVRLERIHLEEDAGKNVHGDQSSYVDLNRSGIALVEIVSKPDLRAPEDAAEYLKRLRALVRHLGICDGNLEEGSFRCDANVSIRPKGQEKFGTRCEIKNLNSFRNIEKAINYEILRQADVIESGGRVVQETMLYDPAAGKTRAMRSKEEAHDYRYFPEPDLKPLIITAQRIEDVKAHLPELPEAMALRFKNLYELSDYDAAVLTSEKELAQFFEDVNRAVGEVVKAKIVANWVLSEYLREANQRDWNLENPPISASTMAELLCLMGKGVISGKIAKQVFEIMVEEGGQPEAIVRAKGLIQISDPSQIGTVIDKVLNDSPAQLAEYLSGKEKIYGFFVGQIMKASQGKFNPDLLNQILAEKLNERRSKN